MSSQMPTTAHYMGVGLCCAFAGLFCADHLVDSCMEQCKVSRAEACWLVMVGSTLVIFSVVIVPPLVCTYFPAWSISCNALVYTQSAFAVGAALGGWRELRLCPARV